VGAFGSGRQELPLLAAVGIRGVDEVVGLHRVETRERDSSVGTRPVRGGRDRDERGGRDCDDRE
jgi:hypothetical protein